MDDLVPEQNPPEDADASDDELVGSTLDGRFRIDELIGAGGMGRVYKGSQLSVERDVAIKVLHGELSLDEELKKRFFREAKVVSNFTHPNIVRLIDFGKDEEHGLLYLVMDLVQGLGLDELLEHGRLRPELGMRIAHQTCGALVEAHNGGVIHRDLKAENLLLSPVSDGTLQTKVVDFGIAYPEEASEKLTRTGRIYGTASYMAPEQARGKEVDRRADLFSLGVLMFEMLTGKLPITGTNSMEVMIKQIQEGPPPLSRVIPPGELPDRIFGLVDQLLEGDPEDRPADAAEVRDTLEAVFAEQGWQPIRVDTNRPTVEMFEPWIEPALDIDEDQAVERPDDGGAGSEAPEFGKQQTAPETSAGGGSADSQTGTGAAGSGSTAPPSGDRGRPSGPGGPSPGTGPEPQQGSTSNRSLLTIALILGGVLIVLVPIAAYVGLVVLSPESDDDSGLDEVATASGPDAEAENEPDESSGESAPSGGTDEGTESESDEKDPVCGAIERDPLPEKWRETYKPQDGSGDGSLKLTADKLNARWGDAGATAFVAQGSASGSEYEVSCARFTGSGDGERCSGSIRRRGPVLIVRLEGNDVCEERFSGSWLPK